MSFDLKLQTGDLVYNFRKDIATVRDSDKLIQDCLKIISTPLNGNPLFPWYGCPITQSLVGTAYDTNFTANIATQQLQAALDTLQNLQKEQVKTSQIVTPQEQIAAIQGVNVQRNVTDMRFFQLMCTILSKAYVTVPVVTNVQL